ncbi:MAG: LytR/AlgR family response regulator transcription factor [Marinifilaceae bacterium]
MLNFQTPIPSYLTAKGNLVRLILSTSVFALVFINIYSPFGVQTLYHVTRWELFFYSSLVILTGVLVVVISRVLMFRYCRKHELRYWQYIGWMLLEVFCMAMFYAAFEKFALSDGRDFSQLLAVSVENTSLVLLLPYSVLWLYFSWREKEKQLNLLEQEHPEAVPHKNMIPFCDENGVLRFSVKAEDFYYLEAADNYVNIYYQDREKVVRFVLRNSLKRMEAQLAKLEVVRCHRSFMVNFEKVKLIRKEKEGLRLELDSPCTVTFPVSKTYMEKVMTTFGRFSR